jgi:arginine-tRNA-protein transferase
VYQRNQDLQVTAVAPLFKLEHFKLYCRYLETRHRGGGMDNPTPDSYMQFLTSTWAETIFYEFRLNKQLLGVAVTDHFDRGMSAVYTFFDPDVSERSLGTYAVLWEIQETQQLNLDWLYLGYWIAECRKMSYKTAYQPLEHYHNGTWRIVDPQKIELQLLHDGKIIRR